MTLDGVVGDELELRGVAEAEGGAQLPAEIAGGGAEALHHFFFVLLVQGADINFCVAEVAGGVYEDEK